MKIFSFDSISQIRDECKGKKIVQCHGVFDLFHYGHLRHLRAAKGHGEILVVSITSDEHVNKGPGRPIFDQKQRAELLASLEFVDYVVISPYKSAVETIEALKPNFFAKGIEYGDTERDLTNLIKVEIEAVERNQGRIVFTDEETYSSSRLINSVGWGISENLKLFLSNFKKKYGFEDVTSVFGKLEGLRVLLIGETIFDSYSVCETLGKSGKEPILCVNKESNHLQIGGAYAIAKNLAGLGIKVDFLTFLGNDPLRNRILENQTENMQIQYIETRSRNIVKERIIDKRTKNKIFEIYEMDRTPLDYEAHNKLRKRIVSAVNNYDLVMVADYGHGLIDKNSAKIISNLNKFTCINTQTNAENFGLNTISKYSNVDFFTLNKWEMELELRKRLENNADGIMDVFKKLGATSGLITLGSEGSEIWHTSGRYSRIPNFDVEVVDRVGAGDSIFSIAGPLMYLQVDFEMILLISNLVGAWNVRFQGASMTLSTGDILKQLKAILS